MAVDSVPLPARQTVSDTTPHVRDHEWRGSARAPALQAITLKLGIQGRDPGATLNISDGGAGWSTARARRGCVAAVGRLRGHVHAAFLLAALLARALRWPFPYQ